MLRNVNKIRLFKELFICVIIVFLSICFSNISLFYNSFVFVIPFIIFCFMNNKWYGYLSFFSSYLVIGSYNAWFYLSYLFVLLGIVFLKVIIGKDNGKLKNVISFYCFFSCVLEGVVSLFIYESSNYFILFVLGVISYWVMRYFYELYVNYHVSDKRYLTPYLLVFVFSLLGIALLGFKVSNGWFNLSLVFIILLSFIGSKVSLEVGVLYSFVMLVMFRVMGINLDVFLFFSSSLVVFFLNKTSKVTLLFTYSLMVFSFLFYEDLSYLIGINYCLGAFLFLLIPNKFILYLKGVSYGSDVYIDNISKENKRFNLNIANKIIKMEEVFSLVSSKLNVKGRLRKNEKELLIEEINVFDQLFKSFAGDIKDNCEFNYYSRVEKEIYKYGYDLVYLDIKENVFKDFIVSLNIRCEKKEIDTVVKPLISKSLKKNLNVCEVRKNDIFDYYEIKFVEEKDFNFSYGIKQRAKDKEECGDSYLVYENESKKIFALSDGMGVGKVAKRNSKLALELFKKFMDIGFEEEQTINSINFLLKEEYSKDSYATLDLFVYDKHLKQFYFYKNGACDSFIIRNEDVYCVEEDKLPIGIMEKINVEKRVVNISKGDYVVMVSDGVSDSKLSRINCIKRGNPVNIANDVLKDSNDINDDESIIVIKIK